MDHRVPAREQRDEAHMLAVGPAKPRGDHYRLGRARGSRNATCGPWSLPMAKRSSLPSRSQTYASPSPCARRPSHERTSSGSGPYERTSASRTVISWPSPSVMSAPSGVSRTRRSSCLRKPRISYAVFCLKKKNGTLGPWREWCRMCHHTILAARQAGGTVVFQTADESILSTATKYRAAIEDGLANYPMAFLETSHDQVDMHESYLLTDPVPVQDRIAEVVDNRITST